MLNQIVLVGRLIEKPKLEKGTIVNIEIAVPRSYKNKNGEYDTDFIPCIMQGEIAKNIVENLDKGDLVGVKGALQVEDKVVKVRAEKITFLSSKREEEK